MEEKRNRLLNIYHEHKEVFNLKEMEKLGAKAGVGMLAFYVWWLNFDSPYNLLRSDAND